MAQGDVRDDLPYCDTLKPKPSHGKSHRNCQNKYLNYGTTTQES